MTGALIGGLATRNARGALAGAVAGGVAGGTTAYLVALRDQQQSQSAISAQINTDLARDNAQIDRTQIAFDQLVGCRFAQADRIRADLATGRIDRPTAVAAMAAVQQHSQNDFAIARRIDGQIRGRSDQFYVAADYVAPGTRTAVEAPPPRRPVTVRRAAPVRLTPAPDAPEIGQVSARDRVTATRTRGDYVLVETASGTEGYVSSGDLQGAPPAGRRSVTPGVSGAGAPGAFGGSGDSGDVRSLAGSNAARRDTFADSVSVSEKAAKSGFELAG